VVLVIPPAKLTDIILIISPKKIKNKPIKKRGNMGDEKYNININRGIGV
tara:strand:+ start:170 stop:316 length:147 start_codon:yes stop_codon:yes gene_type:complete